MATIHLLYIQASAVQYIWVKGKIKAFPVHHQEAYKTVSRKNTSELYITCTMLKIALKSSTKFSDDKLLSLLASDKPPPESPISVRKGAETHNKLLISNQKIILKKIDKYLQINELENF